MASDAIIRLGQVVSVDDETGGGRIKVRLMEDHNISHKDLPYAFPLAPKTIQSVPKVGECALVFLTNTKNTKSQRYYLGPIISQPQDMEWAPYVGGSGSAISLLDGSIIQPRESIDDFASTVGAFPNKNDIAIIGRKSEDVILKEGEIDLRCGVRKNADGTEERDLVGPVVFNSENPAYIQMRYKKGLLANDQGDGVINVVADKINLVSNRDQTNDIPLTNTDGVKNPLLDDSDMYDLMNKLHNTTYGDVLVPILEKICNAITTHVHNAGPKPPDDSPEIVAVKSLDLWSIVSPFVRIS